MVLSTGPYAPLYRPGVGVKMDANLVFICLNFSLCSSGITPSGSMMMASGCGGSISLTVGRYLKSSVECWWTRLILLQEYFSSGGEDS